MSEFESTPPPQPEILQKISFSVPKDLVIAASDVVGHYARLKKDQYMKDFGKQGEAEFLGTPLHSLHTKLNESLQTKSPLLDVKLELSDEEMEQMRRAKGNHPSYSHEEGQKALESVYEHFNELYLRAKKQKPGITSKIRNFFRPESSPISISDSALSNWVQRKINRGKKGGFE